MSTLLRRIVFFRLTTGGMVVGKLVFYDGSAGRAEVQTAFGVRSYPLSGVEGVIQEVCGAEKRRELELQMAAQEKGHAA